MSYRGSMALRHKRSISLPPDLDAQIESAAALEGISVSAWIAEMATRRLRLDGGRQVIEDWEAEHGAFTLEERAEARAWALSLLAESSVAEVSP